jgi:ABC-type multidrug transport system fused ATPase/permease subunit
MLKARLQAIFADRYGAPAMIRRLLSEYGFAHWRRYATAFALMSVSAGCTALSAYLMGQVINVAYINRNFPGIAALGLVTVVLFLIKGLSTYGHSVILGRIAGQIVAANQRRMFDKLLNQSVAYFADRHSSEFMARMWTGALSASLVLSILILAIGRDLLSLLGLVAVMIVQDPIMSLGTLVVAPPAMLFIRKLVRRIRAVASSQFTSGAQILETMQEAIQGISIVKAFALEQHMQRRLDASVAAVEQATNKMARLSNRSGPLMEALGGLAVALAVIYGGYRVIETNAPPGAFFSFIAAFLLAYEPAKRLARLNLELHSGLVGVRILFELIDSDSTEPIEDDKPPLLPTSGRVEFSHVAFAYRPDEPALRDLSFVAEPGKITALVGPSGGGKSTALALLLRFYDPQGGKVLIDGRDLATVSRRSLRRQIGYVGQQVHLFRGSIRENIALGKLDATEAEIIAAAKAACAHDFIVRFPAGYDTPVGEHGLQLSGGERQRVAIARALMKDAPIILLDEATASLDSESERQVQEAFARLCRGRTTLVVAHRLHTIMHADRILVIEMGTVVESGRHDELLRRAGRYASLFRRLQLGEQAPHDAGAKVAASG